MKKSLSELQEETRWSKPKNYLEWYEYMFSGMRDQPIKMLELGVSEGSSLYMWREYFENGSITGLDILDVEIEDPTGRLHIYQGEQQDTALLDQIALEQAPDGFDVIIDDASHVGQLTRLSFWHLLENHLKPGGLYIIEDWGTSYWPGFVDGRGYRDKSTDAPAIMKALTKLRAKFGEPKSWLLKKALNRAYRATWAKNIPGCQRGMVGFVKELIDEAGRPDYTDPNRGIGPKKESRISFVTARTGLVVAVKADPNRRYAAPNW